MRKSAAHLRRRAESEEPGVRIPAALLDRLPAFAVLLSGDGSVLYANGRYRELFGDAGRREEPDSLRIPAAGRPAERDWIGPDGRMYRIYAASGTDSDGTGLVLELGVDVTAPGREDEERRRLHEELAAQRRLFESVVENAPAGIALLRAPGFVYEFVNPAYQALASRKAMLGRPFAEVWPELASRMVPVLQDVLAMRRPYRAYDVPLEIRRSPEGPLERAFFTISYMPVDAEKERPAVLVLAAETTERKRIEEAVRQSSQNFRRFFDQSPIGAAIASLDRRFLRVNDALCRITGYTPKEMAVLNLTAVTHPDDRGKDDEPARRLVAGDIDQYQVDKRFVRKDGEIRWVRLSVRMLKDSRGHPLYFLPMMEDITRRRQAEEELERYRRHLEELVGERTAELTAANEQLQKQIAERERFEAALKESNEFLRTVIQGSPLGIVAYDTEGRVTIWNPAAERIFGWTEREVLGRRNPAVPPEEQDRSASLLRSVMEGKRFSGIEMRRIRKDGEWVTIVWSGAPLREESGRIYGSVTILADVTETKRAAREIRMQSQMLDLASDPIIIWDTQGTITYWNKGAERLYGRTQEEAVGGNVHALLRTFFPLPIEQIMERLLMRGSWDGELVKSRPDGTRLTVSSHWTLWHDEKGNPSAIVEIDDDVTARKEAEGALRMSEERFRSFVQNFQGIAYRADLDFTLVFLHGAVEKITGYTESEIGAGNPRWSRIVHPDDLPYVEENERKAATVPDFSADLEYRIVRRDGEVRWVHEIFQTLPGPDGGPALIQGAIYDITELKQAEEALRRSEEQLRQAQKMEAIGRLAGGIAHDFNNLLTAVTGYSEILLGRLSAESPLRRDALEIRKAGDRAAALTRQLLAFSRRQVLQPKVIDLNEIVAGMENMVRRLIGEDIELVTIRGPELWEVRADPGQIEQVIVNLAVNARDAMPRGGQLSIETANVDLTPEDVGPDAAGRPAPHVLLAISDTGVGMDKETQAHIFEPFFTTKETGKGTGLGLSTVYGIVTQSGGHIEVRSERERGSTFRIYLPRAGEEEPRVQAAPGTPAKESGGTETILLAEDEDAVRTLAAEVLRMNGYRVLEARNGEEAMLIFEGHRDPVPLVVTDVVMPRMSGPELARRLNALRPGTRFLFMSGHSESVAELERTSGATAFIQKPFSPKTLARRVRELLDAPPGAEG